MTLAVNLTIQQLRAARGLLNWSNQDLADALGVSLATACRVDREGVERRPVLARAIRSVLEDHGIVFVPDGVTLTRREPRHDTAA